MIEVRMNTLYAGPNGNCHPGGKITVGDDEAKSLVEGRYAEYVEQPSEASESEESTGSSDEEVIEQELPEGLIKLGGGYFELPNGEKVRGKDKALAAYETWVETQ